MVEECTTGSGSVGIYRVLQHNRGQSDVPVDGEGSDTTSADEFGKSLGQMVEIGLHTAAPTTGSPATTPGRFLHPKPNDLPNSSAEWVRGNDGKSDFVGVGQRSNSVKLGKKVTAALAECDAKTLTFTDHRDSRRWWTTVLNLWSAVGKFNRSDHKPFWDENVTCVVLNDTVRWRGSPYHQQVDVPEFVDYRMLENISAALTCLAGGSAKTLD